MFDFFKKKKKQEENLSEQDTNITEEKLSEEEEFAQNETNSEHAKDSEKQDTLKEEKKILLNERKGILSDLGISEMQLVPQYSCKKCSDTGFLPSGTACDCYKN